MVQLGIQENQLRVFFKKQVFRSKIVISHPTQSANTFLISHYKLEVYSRDNLVQKLCSQGSGMAKVKRIQLKAEFLLGD